LLEFDWDEENLQHIERHRVTAAEAEYVLRYRTLDLGYQDWHGEERYAEVGATERWRILMVITTWRGHRIRVVTAYDASNSDAAQYRAMMVSQ
jgi:uncharacterized DUF497 family protein